MLVITEPMLDCREKMFEICKWPWEEEGDKLISQSLCGVNCLGKPSPGSIHMDDVFCKSKVIERVVGIKGSPMCRVNKFSCLMCKYCWCDHKSKVDFHITMQQLWNCYVDFTQICFKVNILHGVEKSFFINRDCFCAFKNSF